LVPALSWLVARIKLRRLAGVKEPPLSGDWEPAAEILSRVVCGEGSLPYAVLLGRIVKSRTWVRMLDICIPFSCETKGRISAMN
jgi:hypothetical protein